MRFEGRRIVGGRAEGLVLASDRPLSLLGGVDPETGVVRDPESPLRGESLAGRVLCLPHAKGSTVGSYVLYGLRKRGVAPAAILAARAETILAVGAVLAEVPMVDSLPVDLFRSGERAAIDGGVVEMPDLQERRVVTSFLERDGRFLVVRRGEQVGSFRGKWSGVSGFLEGDEDPEARARQEAEEETGIRDLALIAKGPLVRARGADPVVYAIHPFRFRTAAKDVRLDWENVEFRWVTPEELATLDGVPNLAKVFRATL